MKVYSISKWAFWGIMALILVLPVSRHWRLLTGGRTATGEVTGYDLYILETRIGDDRNENASTIVFNCNGQGYTTHGPYNYQYRTGRMVKVMYDPAEPDHNCVLTFSGFYLDNYSILPLILVTVWGAFYLSFNNYRKKRHSRNSATPASSPYRPSGTPFSRSVEEQIGRSRDYPRISPKDS